LNANPLNITEDSLILSLKNRDVNAFEMLYNNYSKAVFAVIVKIVNSREIAEELIQDVFLKVWNNIGTYDNSKGRLYTWLIGIARNLSIDTLRSKDYKKNTYKSLDYINDVSYNEPGEEDHKAIELEGINKYLEKLKEEQRVLIELAYFQGLTQKEISEQLSISLGTVKTRIRSAMMKLRELMKEENLI
jgi:RNA polymerase sigma factor (sigma-70 family)